MRANSNYKQTILFKCDFVENNFESRSQFALFRIMYRKKVTV
ncbi:hypothetical protein XIS1_650024 [Xenorhabdus innexi]|uniref:Uncharacterized protein n=1 Tax=Xenorhabdus innexi TaxID=290109 RepID=A0A1N6N076_9GAMM|nr:hypothetical protein XIS1_650024 [Xenorhabdus innexi]